MKAAILVVVLLGGIGFLAWNLVSSSSESFNPTEQGKEVRATVAQCANWTEVLDRAGAPSKWRNSTSDFDFDYTVRFDEDTRSLIAGLLEKSELSSGFSFLYRFSDAATFAVNFNRKGKLSNIQDWEGAGDLMKDLGG